MYREYFVAQFNWTIATDIIMAQNETVKLVFGQQEHSLRIDQCTVDNIRRAYTFGQNSDIWLSSRITKVLLFPGGGGNFDVVGGDSYDVYLEERDVIGTSGFPVGSTVSQSSPFSRHRIPLPYNTRHGGSSRQFLDADSMQHHQTGIAELRQIPRRRGSQPQLNSSSPIVLDKLQLYFNLGKWTEDGKVVNYFGSDGVTEVPVTFDKVEMSDISKMNKRVTETIKAMEELKSWEAEGFCIHRPSSKSKAVNCDQMNLDGYAYWKGEKDKGRRYWIVPEFKESTIDRNPIDEMEEELNESGARGGKRKSGNYDTISNAVLKMVRIMDNLKEESKNNQMKFLTSMNETFAANQNEVTSQIGSIVNRLDTVNTNKAVKYDKLMAHLQSAFECNICLGITAVPMACTHCGSIIGCKNCVKYVEGQESTSDDRVLKNSGTVKCPKCEHVSRHWDLDGSVLKLKMNMDFIEKIANSE